MKVGHKCGNSFCEEVLTYYVSSGKESFCYGRDMKIVCIGHCNVMGGVL